ncbi:hypothetical protein ISN45_Aa07g034910 [Arabidopsis thaliana x Arabidopsis arenosa]|uniref:Uncharacterized protein n=1 Tax=Arabidopsis thaliana x Arabidopsis arenosa TaxID=1240361 RepID=A0A8T1YBH6_9BRAS|nr:hypothetical protein ISN45_Aa07g034910 [Arabidopsis thaliana x Arabidopsis arenosa]
MIFFFCVVGWKQPFHRFPRRGGGLFFFLFTPLLYICLSDIFHIIYITILLHIFQDFESQGVGQMGSEPMQDSQIQIQPDVHVSIPSPWLQRRCHFIIIYDFFVIFLCHNNFFCRLMLHRRVVLLVILEKGVKGLGPDLPNPEECFNNSMKKLKAISSISLGDGAHAVGGMDDCVEFLPDSIDVETKKLVSALILAGVP